MTVHPSLRWICHRPSSGRAWRYFPNTAAVLEADGSPMSVRTALQLINRFLAEDDFDPDTQFCLALVRAARLGRRPLSAMPTLSPAARAPALMACKVAGYSA